MITLTCDRCGKTIHGKRNEIIALDKEEKTNHSFLLCRECYVESVDFMTPAYIPGICNTRWELGMHYKRKKDRIDNRPVRKVKKLRISGYTVPEIAQELGIKNIEVMKIIKKLGCLNG